MPPILRRINIGRELFRMCRIYTLSGREKGILERRIDPEEKEPFLSDRGGTI
jgi:hypothetical protein